MAKKIVLLTIPEPILEKLEKDMEKRGFEKLQELIIDVVRDNYFRKSKRTGGKRGPKRGLDERKIIGPKPKKGKRISEPWI